MPQHPVPEAPETSGDKATPGRKRNPAVEPVCLRRDVFNAHLAKATAKQGKTAAQVLRLDRWTLRRLLTSRSYEPTVGTAIHIARILNTRVEKLWAPCSEVPATEGEVA